MFISLWSLSNLKMMIVVPLHLTIFDSSGDATASLQIPNPNPLTRDRRVVPTKDKRAYSSNTAKETCFPKETKCILFSNRFSALNTEKSRLFFQNYGWNETIEFFGTSSVALWLGLIWLCKELHSGVLVLISYRTINLLIFV